MKDIKQSLSKALDSFLIFALKKDESSAIKYKNLAIIIGVVVAIFVVCIITFASCSHKTMIKHPADVNSEEVSFEDNNAVAVDPYNETELNAQSKLIQNQNTNSNENALVSENTATDEINVSPLSANDNQNNAVSESPFENEEVHKTQTNNTNVFLYCNKYKSGNDAQESKANIAFSAGLMSAIVKHNGSFTLQLGPYESREEALGIFEKLDNKGLVDECTLEIKD